MISDSDESQTTDNHEYTIDDYYKLVKPLWSHKNVKFDPKIDHHKVFRTLVDFSLTRTMLLSDLKKTSIAVGDIFVAKVRNIDCLVVRINNHNSEIRSSIAHITNSDSEQSANQGSKSLNTNHPQYRSCLRSKYIEFCPHSAIGAYLFSRFHIPDYDEQFEFDLSGELDLPTVQKVKLLRGHNNLVPMSGSQQMKTQKKALEIAGFDPKETNLEKLLVAHAFELPKEMSANSLEELPFDVLIQVAGFESGKDYSILRGSIDPPQNLLEKIFPFINEDLEGSKSDTMIDDGDNEQQLKEVLKMLRKSLCQDMLIIKKRYPHNPLSNSEIFNSPEFEAFVKKVENDGEYDRLMRESCFNPQDDETESDSEDPWPSSIDFDSKEDLQRLVELQSNKLRKMEKDIANNIQHQHQISNHLYDFIAKQTEIMNKQSDFLRNIQNSINGLIILSSSKNKSNEYLAQQSLQDTARYINSGENEHIRAGIDNTLQLLSRMRGGLEGTSAANVLQQVPSSVSNPTYSYAYNQPMPPVHQVPPPPPQPQSQQQQQQQQQIPAVSATTHRLSDTSISTRSSMVSTSSPHFRPALSHFLPQQPHPSHPHHSHHSITASSLSHTPISQIPHHQQQHSQQFQSSSSSSLLTQGVQLQQQQQQQQQQPPAPKTPRELTLQKRLSRQATTLYEMWDDFKTLEQELAQHDISVTEWLKVHGSSERQFRHTRLKIIKFVEEEAMRRNAPVEVVKEMLHNKMRNRLRPWTLDEVQRMLTSGRRIDLDDPRL
ncbi:hypothetical protein I9W82_001543 [Candida metapsilosis]|uniref:Ndc10 domain-containing protein n=1 Tax=Candida metapsilosis TaxID=273372 RepID=A0A8H8DAU4_9ASCO|nr:hypothetical protein I9W82_001543 [Candida metapsilosis]